MASSLAPLLKPLRAPFRSLATPATLRRLWARLRVLPGGGRAMGALIGRMAPYTGTIRPEILALDPGYAKVRMRDRHRVRNHLRSLHAIALMNLGEVATGVAMLFSVPDGSRGIVTHLSMDYLKKARGTITGECRCPVPQAGADQEYEVHAELTDESGDVVARAHARWLVGPST